MFKYLFRIVAMVVAFASTASAAQGLDEMFDNIVTSLERAENYVDTGFIVSDDKYGFGARKDFDKDTSLNFGVGGRAIRSPEYNLSRHYGGADTRTNMIEEQFNPINSTPTIGVSLDYKF